MADTWILANTKYPQLHFPLTLSASVCFFYFRSGPWILLPLCYFLPSYFIFLFLICGVAAQKRMIYLDNPTSPLGQCASPQWNGAHTFVHTAMQTWMYTQTDSMTRPLRPGTHTSVQRRRGGVWFNTPRGLRDEIRVKQRDYALYWTVFAMYKNC